MTTHEKFIVLTNLLAVTQNVVLRQQIEEKLKELITNLK